MADGTRVGKGHEYEDVGSNSWFRRWIAPYLQRGEAHAVALADLIDKGPCNEDN